MEIAGKYTAKGFCMKRGVTMQQQTGVTTATVFWNVHDVAEFCGVTDRTVYLWVSEGRLRKGIEYFRPHGVRKIRFDAAKIQEWFRSGGGN
jgi:excisionase family DNA binding protein